MAKGRKTSGSKLPSVSVSSSLRLVYLCRNRYQMGSTVTARYMPMRMPQNVNPTCQELKPYTLVNMRGKEPKKRQNMPRRIEEKIHRTRHIGSNKRSSKGRITQDLMTPTIEFSTPTFGAIHRLSPVSFRSLLAFCLIKMASINAGLVDCLPRAFSAAKITYDKFPG